MDTRIINFVFAIGCFIAIMFVTETRIIALLALASIANIISLSEQNIIKALKEEE